MKKYIFKILRFLALTLFGLAGLIALYLIAAIIFSIIPCNNDFILATNGIEIYVLSNGVHSDLVLPAKNELKDWTAVINPANTISKDTSINYMAFGWGDKGFYLETPTWADLKFSTAFKAMFTLSGTAMHITNYKIVETNEACKKIWITQQNYGKLVRYIESSFLKNETGNFLSINNHHYKENDAFYEATGSYSLFHTCNTWTNNGMKCGGIKTCLWTPFVREIFFHLNK